MLRICRTSRSGEPEHPNVQHVYRRMHSSRGVSPWGGDIRGDFRTTPPDWRRSSRRSRSRSRAGEVPRRHRGAGHGSRREGRRRKSNLHVPENYRAKYRFIGSWAVAADSGSGSKEMHTVYASPGAVEGYLKTGHFEDGAVLVKEVFAATTGDMTTGTVSHVDSLKGWFVMVRDSKNIAHPGNPLWGDGWGWSWFDADKPLKTTSTDYHNDCMGCHVPATPTDFIYVQGYPSLKKK